MRRSIEYMQRCETSNSKKNVFHSLRLSHVEAYTAPQHYSICHMCRSLLHCSVCCSTFGLFLLSFAAVTLVTSFTGCFRRTLGVNFAFLGNSPRVMHFQSVVDFSSETFAVFASCKIFVLLTSRTRDDFDI